MNEREKRITDFQVWLAVWIHKTEPGSDIRAALKEADDALDLVFALAIDEEN